MQTLFTTRRGVPAALGLLVFVIALACGSGTPAEPTAEPPSAEEALESARSAMAQVDQFRFELTHPKGITTLPGDLGLRRAEGAVIVPGQLSVEAEADIGRIFVRVEAIVIDDQTWMTNPLTGNWSSIPPADSPFRFLDPLRLVTNVIEQASEPVYPQEGGISGGEIVLNGVVPSEALQPLVGEIISGRTLNVQLRLDRDTFLLNSARLTGVLQPGDESDSVRLIRFSGYESELTIEPPV